MDMNHVTCIHAFETLVESLEAGTDLLHYVLGGCRVLLCTDAWGSEKLSSGRHADHAR